MVNLNSIFTLDPDSLTILKDKKNKSEFVRNAIKLYEGERNKPVQKEPEKPLRTKATVKEVII